MWGEQGIFCYNCRAVDFIYSLGVIIKDRTLFFCSYVASAAALIHHVNNKGVLMPMCWGRGGGGGYVVAASCDYQNVVSAHSPNTQSCIDLPC